MEQAPKYIIRFSVHLSEDGGPGKEIGFNDTSSHARFSDVLFEAAQMLEHHILSTELPWDEFQAELKRLKESDQ